MGLYSRASINAFALKLDVCNVATARVGLPLVAGGLSYLCSISRRCRQIPSCCSSLATGVNLQVITHAAALHGSSYFVYMLAQTSGQQLLTKCHMLFANTYTLHMALLMPTVCQRSTDQQQCSQWECNSTLHRASQGCSCCTSKSTAGICITTAATAGANTPATTSAATSAGEQHQGAKSQFAAAAAA